MLYENNCSYIYGYIKGYDRALLASTCIPIFDFQIVGSTADIAKQAADSKATYIYCSHLHLIKTLEVSKALNQQIKVINLFRFSSCLSLSLSLSLFLSLPLSLSLSLSRFDISNAQPYKSSTIVAIFR